MTKAIAVLGLGTMGRGMALNLHHAGFEVQAWNRSPGRATAVQEAGATIAKTPAEAAGSADVVIACLSNDEATASVLLDPELLKALRPGALVMDCGTTSQDLTERLARAVADRGADFMDGPVTGSKLGAEAGRLTFMVGGPEDRVTRVRPLLEAMGRHVVHAGPRVGDGQRIKYCLNMTQAIVLQGVLEGYALAEAQGVSMQALAEVFEHSAGKTGVGSFKTPYLLEQDFTPHFRLDLMRKDLHLALDRARAHGQAVPLAHAVTSLYDMACQQGWGPEDFLATARLLEPEDS